MTFPLTVDDLREHVESSLGDPALQRLLDDAEAAIVARIGPLGARTQIAGGGYRFIALHRPAASITSVTERYGLTDTILATDDYVIRPGGLLLERRTNGTNPRGYHWAPRVTVVYTPASEDPICEGVQLDLVRLQLNYNPSLSAQTIGTWSESYANNSVWNNAEEREAILGRLNGEPMMVVVGSAG